MQDVFVQFTANGRGGGTHFKIWGDFIFANDKIVNVWCDQFPKTSQFEIYMKFLICLPIFLCLRREEKPTGSINSDSFSHFRLY